VVRLKSYLFSYLLLKVLRVLPSKPLHPDLGIERGREVCINHHIHPRVASANPFIFISIFSGLSFFKSFKLFGLLMPRDHVWDHLLYVSGRTGSQHAIFAFQHMMTKLNGSPIYEAGLFLPKGGHGSRTT